MTLVLALGFAIVSFAPAEYGPFTAPAGDVSRCWVEPLQLTLGDVAAFGRVEEEYVKHNCMTSLGAYYDIHRTRTYTVGKTELGSFGLLGEQLGIGVDVVVQPGHFGEPDLMYATPQLRLPESWMQAIDYAT